MAGRRRGTEASVAEIMVVVVTVAAYVRVPQDGVGGKRSLSEMCPLNAGGQPDGRAVCGHVATSRASEPSSWHWHGATHLVFGMVRNRTPYLCFAESLV